MEGQESQKNIFRLRQLEQAKQDNGNGPTITPLSTSEAMQTNGFPLETVTSKE